jgi:hypothetical protein
MVFESGVRSPGGNDIRDSVKVELNHAEVVGGCRRAFDVDTNEEG